VEDAPDLRLPSRQRWISKFAAVVIILMAGTVAGTIYVGASAIGSFQVVHDNWSDFRRNIHAKERYLSEIKRRLGYDGFIHNFKNFVLRKDERLLEKLRDHGAALRESLDGYEKLGVAGEERKALLTLNKVIGEYVKNIKIAEQMAKEGNRPAAIDKAVLVDDAPAAAAMNALDHFLDKNLILAMDNIQRAVEEGQETVRLGFFILPVLIAMAVVFPWFLRWLVLELGHRYRAERRLQRSKDKVEEGALKLKEANASLSEYAYAVSHDLKSPLRAVRNYGDFLKEDLGGTLKEEQQGYLDGLSRAINEADNLVNDLLSYGQIDKAETRFQEVDLQKFFVGMVADMKATEEPFHDGGITMSGEFPVVETAPTMLRQIFSNLISNGLKFNRSEAKEVQLLGSADGAFCQIIVKDNGIGIDPKFFDRVFQVFQRLHTKTEYEGTGIGLAIVKKAVARLEGKVQLQSEPGKGSSFSITLPLTRSKELVGIKGS
jgi:signal transduction histidine kinase